MTDSLINRIEEVRIDQNPTIKVDQDNFSVKPSFDPKKSLNTSPTMSHSDGKDMKEAKSSLTNISLADVHLHFKVDPVTHEVTVLVLDKTNNKVIRTIPPEELAQLQQGGLLELSR